MSHDSLGGATFQLYTPGSLRLYTFDGHDAQAQLTAEVRRTVDMFTAGAPARIASGRSTRPEAEAVIALWRAIAQDLDLNQLPPGSDIDAQLRELRAANGVAWADKVAALRREIEARRAQYPADVDKGRLTRDQAKQQLERLEAVHDLYWRLGYAFDGTRDELRAMSGPILDTYLTQPSGGDSSTRAPGDQPGDSGSNPLPRSTAGVSS